MEGWGERVTILGMIRGNKTDRATVLNKNAFEMTIELNGEQYRVENARDLRSLVEEVQGDRGTEGVAVAVEREVVPRSQWEETLLEEGRSVEIIRATQGG